MSRPRKTSSSTALPVPTRRIAYRYRAYLSDLQKFRGDNWLFALGMLYNGAVSERKASYQEQGKSVTYATQQNALPKLRKLNPELRMIHSQVEQDCLQRVDKAYQKFFDDITKKDAGQTVRIGYPRMKKLARYSSLSYPQVWLKRSGKEDLEVVKFRRVNKKFAVVTLPGFGDVKIRLHRPLDWKAAKTVTLKREPSGNWYLSVSAEIPVLASLPSNGKKTGVDCGLTKQVALSDGSYVERPRFIYEAQKRIRIAQKDLSRKKKGSVNYNRQKGKLAKEHEHVANQREDFLHRLSLWLVLAYTYIAFEDLNIPALVRNHHLAKAIHDAGWGMLIRFTTYKSVMLRGESVVKVDPVYTTQDCHRCGCRVPKTLADRMHVCPQCGLVMDRDQNAALGIENKAFVPQTVGPVRPEQAGIIPVNACRDGASATPAFVVSPVAEAGSPD